MLIIRNLGKTYANGVRALDNVTLDIPPACSDCLAPTAPANPR